MSLRGRVKALEKRLENLPPTGGSCPKCGKPEGPQDVNSPEGGELIRGYIMHDAQSKRDGQESEDFKAYCLARFCGCEEETDEEQQ